MMIKKGPKARSINQNRVGVALEGRNLRLDPPSRKNKVTSSDDSDNYGEEDPQSGSSQDSWHEPGTDHGVEKAPK